MMNVWLSDIHTSMATIGWGDQFRPALPLFLLHPPRPFFAFFRPRCLTGSVIDSWSSNEVTRNVLVAAVPDAEIQREEENGHEAWSWGKGGWRDMTRIGTFCFTGQMLSEITTKVSRFYWAFTVTATFCFTSKMLSEITTLLSLRHFALLVKCQPTRTTCGFEKYHFYK